MDPSITCWLFYNIYDVESLFVRCLIDKLNQNSILIIYLFHYINHNFKFQFPWPYWSTFYSITSIQFFNRLIVNPFPHISKCLLNKIKPINPSLRRYKLLWDRQTDIDVQSPKAFICITSAWMNPMGKCPQKRDVLSALINLSWNKPMDILTCKGTVRSRSSRVYWIIWKLQTRNEVKWF